jgi:outer membrane protein OmpA-like peptidoglycan-associated protein
MLGQRIYTGLTLLPLAAALVLGGASRVASAQGLDGERFAPAAGAAGGFMIERPVVPAHLGYGLGLFLHLADDALNVRDRATGEDRARLLDTAFSADLLASLGLFDVLELALHLPVRLVYRGDAATMDGDLLEADAGLGDLRLVPKATLYRTGGELSGWVLGVALPVTLPTGEASALRGSGGASVEPRLLALTYNDRWFFEGSLGFRVRGREADYAPGNELTTAAGATFSPRVDGDWLDLHLEVVGGFMPGMDGRALSDLAYEALAGAIFRPALRWSVYLGAGAGLTNGIVVPDFRVVSGVRYAVGLPTRGGKKDRDGDGFTDDKDRCPEDAEDLDGFQDNDGCPEPDNDRDGIADDDDECPEDAEEPSGDKDGCPDRPRIVVRKGKVIVYGKVLFKLGSAEVSPRSEHLLDDMARLLDQHKQQIRRLEIEGYTDSTGGEDFNRKLSQERAQNVKKALVKRGVAERRLTARGYGEEQPIAPNFTNAGRARNRRVEFSIRD